MKIIIIFLLLLLQGNLSANMSQDKMKTMLVVKVAKYIYWNDSTDEQFHITVLGNAQNYELFNSLYLGKQINHKKIKINYIDDISTLTTTDILYISPNKLNHLKEILQTLQHKHIFTISDMDGFAQRGGMLQISFVSQKVQLTINLLSTKREDFKIKSSLLRMVHIIKKDSLNDD